MLEAIAGLCDETGSKQEGVSLSSPYPVFQSPSTKSQVALVIKNLPANARYARDAGSIPGLGRSPGEGNGNPLQYSCQRVPWTEEPGGLQSMRSQKARHNWMTNAFTFFPSPSGAPTGKIEKCFSLYNLTSTNPSRTRHLRFWERIVWQPGNDLFS